MKKIIFSLAALALATACSNESPNNIHPKGIGPVKVGMSIEELPASIEGLYDEIVKIDVDAYYDEFEGDYVPARDQYQFNKDGAIAFSTECPDGETVIPFLDAFSPELSYEGLHPGMSCKEALNTNAKLLAGGYPESCEFACLWGFDAPSIEAWCTGTLLSQSGVDYFTQMSEEELYNYQEPRKDFKAEYFDDEASIRMIRIR